MFMEERRQEGRETKREGGRDGGREGERERENLHQVKIYHLPSLCQNTVGQCQIRGRGQVCDLRAIHTEAHVLQNLPQGRGMLTLSENVPLLLRPFYLLPSELCPALNVHKTVV